MHVIGVFEGKIKYKLNFFIFLCGVKIEGLFYRKNIYLWFFFFFKECN